MGNGRKRDQSKVHLEFFLHIMGVLIICAILKLSLSYS